MKTYLSVTNVVRFSHLAARVNLKFYVRYMRLRECSEHHWNCYNDTALLVHEENGELWLISNVAQLLLTLYI